jgi:hypothetical protein
VEFHLDMLRACSQVKRTRWPFRPIFSANEFFTLQQSADSSVQQDSGFDAAAMTMCRTHNQLQSDIGNEILPRPDLATIILVFSLTAAVRAVWPSIATLYADTTLTMRLRRSASRRCTRTSCSCNERAASLASDLLVAHLHSALHGTRGLHRVRARMRGLNTRILCSS